MQYVLGFLLFLFIYLWMTESFIVALTSCVVVVVVFAAVVFVLDKYFSSDETPNNTPQNYADPQPTPSEPQPTSRQSAGKKRYHHNYTYPERRQAAKSNANGPTEYDRAMARMAAREAAREAARNAARNAAGFAAGGFAASQLFDHHDKHQYHPKDNPDFDPADFDPSDFDPSDFDDYEERRDYLNSWGDGNWNHDWDSDGSWDYDDDGGGEDW